MQDKVDIFLFGDQTYQIGSELSQLACICDDPIVKSFLSRAYEALRFEIAELPESRRQQFSSLPSLPKLLAIPSQGPAHVAINQALTCIYHLASFIRHCGLTRGSYPCASNTFVVGLCTGALAAAAVSCCHSLSELLHVAVYTVRVAFRVGLNATDTADSIERSDSPTEAWSYVFSEKLHLPPTSRLYVSEVAAHGVSVSGPPSNLRQFQRNSASQGLHISPLQIQAPYHAPHLYDKHNFASLLSSSEDLSSYSTYIPVLSTCSGKLRRASDLTQAFRAAVADILINRIDLNLMYEGISFLTRMAQDSQILVHLIGTSAGKALMRTLSENPQRIPSHKLPENDLHAPSPSSQSLATPVLSTASPTTVDGKSRIAILGMSGRFPNADGLSEFWDVLAKGLDVHSIAPSSRWDTATHVDVSGKRKNTSATTYGCWLKRPDLFDPKIFNISPREAPQIDPAQRLALLTAYEAIEQAGIVPDGSQSTQKDRVGVFFGVTSNDWMETNSAQDIDAYFIPGGNRAFIPGRINYCFKFSGPGYSVDTACSSSLAAIHTTCNSLWQRDVDTAIAGGTNILTNPDFTAGLDRGHFLSRTGNCKIFDDLADGYCRGEGAGTVVLKRLDDALLDTDPILGVICDVSTNHNAEAQSITRPCVDAQKNIFRNIIDNTCIEPYDISYVEMHGTGTQAGDAGEMESVLEILAPPSARRKPRSDAQPLYLGSAKANNGHGEAAAGVSSLIKSLLMMENHMIPPHCGIKTRVNHRFPTDFRNRGAHIPAKGIPWLRSGITTRKIFLNKFHPARAFYDRSSHFSSGDCIGEISDSIETQYGSTAVSPGYLLNRYEPSTRAFAALERGDGSTRAKTTPTILFAFTGQGSLCAGMGEKLLNNFSHFRADIDRLDHVAQRLGFPSVRPLIEASNYRIDESDLEVQPYTEGLSCEFACFNSMKDSVISGESHAIHRVRECLGNSSIKATELSVPYAYHSTQVEPVLADLEQLASGVSFRKPLVPVICLLHGQVVTEGGTFGPKYLASHCRNPVDMVSGLNAAQASQILDENTITLEIGPQSVVSAMIKTSLGQQMRTFVSSQRGQEMWPLLTVALSTLYTAGASISWAEYQRDFPMSHRVLRLPAYSWDLQSYWIGYRNDWSLRKGDPLPAQQENEHKPLESTTIHTVVKEEFSNHAGVLVLEADISRPDLSKFVQGHKVNGIPLCTPSVYADIVLTAARYLIDKYRPEQKEMVVDVSDMTIVRALVAHGQDPQLLRVSLDVDWPSEIMKCQFSSTNHQTQKSKEHGHCILHLKDQAEELASLKVQAAYATSSLSRLRQGLLEGKTYRFNRSMIYKMVAAVAEFDCNYRAINDIILDSDVLEACGNVNYNCSDEGSFHTHPAILDALSQVGGFVMNANDSADLDKEVYVNHGWRSFEMFEPISAGKSYQTHVKMEPRQDDLWEGDIMVFKAGRVVACFKGITLQGVAKRALHFILSREAPSKPDTEIKAMGSPTPIPASAPNDSLSHTIAQPPSTIQNNEGRDPKCNDEVVPIPRDPTPLDLQESKSSRKTQQALEIIAEESGIAMSDIQDESNFIAMGIDSLLVLILVERFKEDLQLDIPTSLIMTETVKGLKDHLGGDTRLDEETSSPKYSPTSTLTPDHDSVEGLSPLPKSLPTTPETPSFALDPQKLPCPPATSVVLQGDPNKAAKTLILFPDGAGSASSYIHLPRISPSIAVIGLNSPFIKSPSSMSSYNLFSLMTAYLDELRHRQPYGPYHLAGWSSGGILAYRAAQLLLEQGEEVTQLVLIDSPAPLNGLDRLPEAWYDHGASKNLFGGLVPRTGPKAQKEAIERVMARFRVTIEMLHDYRAEPLPIGCGVDVSVIWAVEAALEKRDVEEMVADEGDSEGLRFLMDRKVDLGTRGWEKLVPEGRMAVEAMEGASHFSMMRDAHAKGLAEIIRRTLR
ncbi:hypothetical protein JMJ35_006867 [Cladonia borealis]|uniref:Polyketide synthase n=1 Tax=Cladonia borealis TaxID=184061 RepID=A0AA39V7K2_9LECA|nr:hypothetical protein JMJ35_006867 [Cladonia borealis]